MCNCNGCSCGKNEQAKFEALRGVINPAISDSQLKRLLVQGKKFSPETDLFRQAIQTAKEPEDESGSS